MQYLHSSFHEQTHVKLLVRTLYRSYMGICQLAHEFNTHGRRRRRRRLLNETHRCCRYVCKENSPKQLFHKLSYHKNFSRYSRHVVLDYYVTLIVVCIVSLLRPSFDVSLLNLNVYTFFVVVDTYNYMFIVIDSRAELIRIVKPFCDHQLKKGLCI